jgi:hypothetical protein
MRMTRALPLLSALVLCINPALAGEEIRVVGPNDDLQAAINAARPGDEIRLAAGATFSGNFILPVTSGTSTITIRTDLPDDAVPTARQRVTPQTATRFARLSSPNNSPALATAPGAHHWRLMLLEFGPNRQGFGDIITIGDGSDQQKTAAQVPYEITLDRLYIHGDPLMGQKRAIALNGRAVTIRNSYITDIKAVGQDTQAIGGWNGPGPFTIENNHLEAAGEVVILGGTDPSIPNLVSEDVSVRYNHMTRPMEWRSAIIAAPGSVSAVATERGSLPAGVYAYRVVARRPVGQGTTGSSAPSAEVTAVASSGAVRITWDAVPDATEYLLYARNAAGVTEFWSVNGTSFLHDGSTPGKRGTPAAAGTVWQVKNVFELKNARRVTVEYNVFENNWLNAQTGYAILFTPRNQDGKCTWCVVEQVTFSHNVVRNASGGFSITGFDSDAVSAQSNHLIIQDNLVYGISTKLGGSGWGFLMGEAVRDVTIDHNTIDFDGTTLLYAYGGTAASPRVMNGVRFTGNAARHNDYGVNGADASPGTLTFQMYFPGIVFTGNWLSGGSPSRYPPGNRFDEPFDAKLNATAPAPADSPGANVARLLAVARAVETGRVDFAVPRGGD